MHVNTQLIERDQEQHRVMMHELGSVGFEEANSFFEDEELDFDSD
jgi:hypothetical protein